MNVLNAKRGRVKSTVTNIGKYVARLNEHSRREEIQVRIEKLENAIQEFYVIIDKINEHVDDDDFVDQTNEIDDLETRYYEYSAKLREALQIVDDASSTDNNTSSIQQLIQNQSTFLERLATIQTKPTEVNLPKINIPTFGGDRTQWKSFADYFTATIHRNTRLTNIQKFHYLRSSLIKDSEADGLIQHIAVTDGNYVEAWNKLSARYDIKTQIVSSFIKMFMELPSLPQQTGTGIRHLCDKSDEIIRGLRALGAEAEHRDNFLVYIIVNKLDAETRKTWCYEKADVEFPGFDELLTFLNKQALALEINKNERSSKPSSQQSKSTGKSLYAHYSNNMPTSCPVCNGSHRIYSCYKFREMNVVERNALVTNKKLCINCLSNGHLLNSCNSNSTCRVCQSKHHSMLHPSDYVSNLPPTVPKVHAVQIAEASTSSSKPESSTNSLSKSKKNPPLTALMNLPAPLNSYNTAFGTVQSILPTALIKVKSANGKTFEARALLDSGSEASFVSHSFIEKIGVSRTYDRQVVNGLANTKVGITRGTCTLHVAINYESTINLNALIIPKISGMIPSSPLNVDCSFAKHLFLADPDFMIPKCVDILIGVDYFFEILRSGKVCHHLGYPFAQETVFGWVICGKASSNSLQSHHPRTHLCLEIDIDRTLQRFWELESVSTPKSLLTPDEQATEDHFLANFSRTNDGRFIVRLPFKVPNPDFGNSLQTAVKRLLHMERKFTLNDHLRKSYNEFMSEYLLLNHMEVVPSDEIVNVNHFYLPHHAVFKIASSTTKIRVVFDGSCKSSNGCSLNDTLHTGPLLQDDLFTILVRFRCHRFALTADAEKMYRQVLVHTDDRNFQRIVWRNQASDEIQHYRLTTVTYGTGPGSFLAIRSLQQLARNETLRYPRAAKIVLNDFYVDDMMSGAESEVEAVQIFDEMVELLGKGCLNLRKWASNSKVLMNAVPKELIEPKLVDVSDVHDLSIKVLGICWMPSSDIFTYKVQLSESIIATKRQILSDSSKIFDPLGWASPVLIRIKILFQALWIHKLDWDDDIPHTLRLQWIAFREDLNILEKLKIPRWLPTHNHTFELHAFCDASEFAYSAVVYVRSIIDHRQSSCKIIAAKTRVTPLKQISLPRLELSGALLLCNLVKSLMVSLQQFKFNVYAWTDSTIVLAWLSEFPRSWKTFVANRCTEILEILPRSQWNHISGSNNPADCASRGISSTELLNNSLWWHGPAFLSDINFDLSNSQEVNQFSHKKTASDVEKERKNSTITVNMSVTTADDFFMRFSSWEKLVRVTAHILRFFNNATKRNPIANKCLTTSEIASSQKSLIKFVQFDSFSEEIKSMRTKGKIKISSRLISLAPFLDCENLLRVGGRLQNSTLTEDTKHPLILSNHHQIAKLIVEDTHSRYFHAGATFMMTQLKQKYWIIGARNLIRKTIRACTTCRRYSSQSSNQVMANLPSYRVQSIRSFAKVGCDFAGPITLRNHTGRNPKHIKGYIALFVCLTTKALHLEAVSDLSTDAFLASFKRFSSRRGIPSDVFSDNGSNFVGAKRVLAEALQFSMNQHHFISESLSKDGTNWHFIPPASPHFGGIWEAGVKSTKFHINRVVNNQVLTFEELSTLLAQIEAILNSRPLCLNPDDDLNPITPSHFLIGQPTTLVPEPDLAHIQISRMSRWQLLQNLMQGFWKRWHCEYLTSKQQRVKWRKEQNDLQPGDVVIIREPNLPPGKWSLGKVEECCTGDDGHVRVVVIRCRGASIKRPITKLIKLFPDAN